MHRRVSWRPVLIVALAGTAVAVLGLAMILAGDGPQPSGPGLPDAGAFTEWALPAARLLANLAAVGCVGTLLVGAALAPPAAGPLGRAETRAVRAAWSWALGWAVAAALTLVLTVSEVAGLPVAGLGWFELARAVRVVAPVRALLVVVALALAVALVAGMARGTTAARLALAIAVVGLTPTLYTGHSAQAAHHTLATGALVVHVVAATGWIGGLLGILVHLRRPGPEQTRAVARFSTLALDLLLRGHGLGDAGRGDAARDVRGELDHRVRRGPHGQGRGRHRAGGRWLATPSRDDAGAARRSPTRVLAAGDR